METRSQYIKRHLSQEKISYLKKIGIIFPKGNSTFQFDWNNYKEHIRNRIHLTNKSDISDFENLFEIIDITKDEKNNLISITKNGNLLQNGIKRFYDFSLLPLNIDLGKNVYKYFIPPLDYFSDSDINEFDPYGLLYKKSRVNNFSNEQVHIIKDNSLLGSHKFTHTFLFNLDFYCPIGCSDCYKSRLGTREYYDGSNTSFFDNIGIVKPTKHRVIDNTKLLVDWMNSSDRGKQIYDVILSGGEPLMLSNKIIRQILNEFKKAKNLRILRICTGTIFLGLPFRITDELISILDNFIRETNIKVTFQVHLGNSEMISPESIIAIEKLKKIGISLYSQTPIKNGINFFLNNFNKTIKQLSDLLFKQNLIGVEPYMFIVDMHPSTNEFYVPIEALLQVWAELVDSHNYPGLEKPRTLSLLFKEGNILLSSHSLFAIDKKIDKEKNIVTYRIPRIAHNTKWKIKIKEFFNYSEPLIDGINDDTNSLKKLQNSI